MRLKLHFSWREKTGKITKFIESKVFQKIRKFKHKKKKRPEILWNLYFYFNL